MNDKQTWMQRLDDYMNHAKFSKGLSSGSLANYRGVVSRWIGFALEHSVQPGQPDEELLTRWVTMKLNLNESSQDGYRSHIRQWWAWNRQRPVPTTTEATARLAQRVAQFRADGYSRARDSEHLSARERFEKILRDLPAMSYADREQVNEVWRKQPGTDADYGGPGNIVQLRSFIKQANEHQWDTLRLQLADLCFGTEDLVDRLQSAVGGIQGLGWTAATRAAAICDPQRVIPNYSLYNKGTWAGKLDNLQMLMDEGLLEVGTRRRAEKVLRDHPPSKLSGRAVVESNDLLLAILQPHFTDGDVVDTWGMRTFLYWFSERYADHGEPATTTAANENAEAWVDEADLAGLADDVLCDVNFLKDIVHLLEDKGQVILYGPPGTGKTYFARRLAWALTDTADDEEYEENGPYSLVQFHPAYSYEDFFEGFRPAVDADGNMTYRLTSGPLVRLAERAAEYPDERHVMVIDEINRANLPRVLGELLYLLEYRDEWTQTQYRPVKGFVLPANLWIIATMNTADRSIALIDAAMRRRFHFVPFFPNRAPTQGLLQRWTQRNAPEQAWVADLLDGINGELEQALGGDHLLIGPSHFMQPGLEFEGLRRIWKYNIEPLIEDQLFGRQDAINAYRFDAVWKRHGPGADAREAPAEPSEFHVDDDDGHTEIDEDESGGNASE